MKRILFISTVLVSFASTASASQQNLLMQMQQDLSRVLEQQAQLTGKIDELQHRISQLEQGGGQNHHPQPNMGQPHMGQPHMGQPHMGQPHMGQPHMNNMGGHMGPSAAVNNDPRAPQPYPNAPKNLDNRMAVDVYNEAQTMMQYGDIEGARAAFRGFVQNFSNDPLVVNARYWLAETYFSVQDYQNAAAEYGEAYQAYQKHKKGKDKTQTESKAPEIVLKLAMSLSRMGRKDEAKVTLSQFDKEFSWAPATYKEQAKRLRSELG